jgi:hypothetical protein
MFVLPGVTLPSMKDRSNGYCGRPKTITSTSSARDEQAAGSTTDDHVVARILGGKNRSTAPGAWDIGRRNALSPHGSCPPRLSPNCKLLIGAKRRKAPPIEDFA